MNKFFLSIFKLLFIVFDFLKYLKYLFFKKNKIVLKKKIHSDSVVIIAIFQSFTLRPDTVNFIDELRKRRVALIVINTSTVNSGWINWLNTVTCVYIERSNYGQCFGSYKTGIDFLQSENEYEKLKNIYFFNDSVFVSPDRLASFLDKYLFEDVCGVTDNYEFKHHVSSFALKFNSKIIKSKDFRDFWKSYRLTSLRQKLIHDGEIELSQVIHKVDKFARVMYPIKSLTNSISKNDLIYFSCYVDDSPAFYGPHTNRYGFSKKNIINMDDIKNKSEQGSSIHFNVFYLLILGCPFVKLDYMLRNIFDNIQYVKFSKLIDSKFCSELYFLLEQKAQKKYSYGKVKSILLKHGYL